MFIYEVEVLHLQSDDFIVGAGNTPPRQTNVSFYCTSV